MTYPFGTMAAYECPGAASTARGVDDPEEVDVPNGTCSVECCTKPVRIISRGWCAMHNTRWKRHGDPLIRNGVTYHADPRVRFMEQVEVVGRCWLWTGQLDINGYGVVHVDGVMNPQKAHRVAYEWFVGPIPDGLVLDHVWANGCRHHNCVNWTEHLEPVTQAENVRRSWAVHAKPACGMGHLFTAENTYIRPSNGHRVCRTCNIARAKAGTLRKREALREGASA